MGLFDFIKRKLQMQQDHKSLADSNQEIELNQTSIGQTQITVDMADWTGKDFEFLIIGDIDIFVDFDNIMTPNTLEWTKVFKDNWDFYQVGQDEYSYSIEPPGIQMTFNKEILFSKAKKIGEEIIQNIIATGQHAELIVLDNTKIYRFD